MYSSYSVMLQSVDFHFIRECYGEIHAFFKGLDLLGTFVWVINFLFFFFFLFF
jgi:hypothetical protein